MILDKIDRNKDTEEICLKELKQLIQEAYNSKELNLPGNLSDELLLRFVRGRKYNAEYAFKTVQGFNKVRLEKYPEFFTSLSPNAYQAIFDSGMMGWLKKRDKLGRKIFWFRIAKWDVTQFNADDILRATILAFEETCSSKETMVNGIVLILDYRGFNRHHAMHYSLADIRKYINIFLPSYPLIFGEGYLLHVPRLVQFCFSLAKPFLPIKVQKRIIFEQGFKSLHANLTPEILPDWLGGCLTEVEARDNEMLKELESKEQFYADFNKNLEVS